MIAWFNQHREALGLAIRRLAATPLGTLLSLLAIGIALALPATGQLLMSNALRLIGSAGSAPQISVFLKLDSERSAVRTLESQLRSNTAIKSVELVPREKTLSRMKTAEGLGDVLDALQRNPFPDSLVIIPVDSSPDALEALAGSLRKTATVEHVQLDSALVRRIDALLNTGHVMVNLLAAILGLGLVAITFSTIRLQVLAHAAEIEVSRLLGATDAFVCRPFHYLGLLQGFFGGLIGWAIVSLAVISLQGPIAELSRLYGMDFRLANLGGIEVTALLLAAALLGWVGAALSVRQHLSRY